MDISGTALAFSGLGAAALATSALALRRRLQLSRAKHRSLAGHSRIARRMARFVPFYAYDENRFFCSDAAPADVAAQRRVVFLRPALLDETRFPPPPRHPPAPARRISDLQFTDPSRVPFQYSRFVRRHLPIGAFVQSSDGVTVTDLDGNTFYDLTGSYGVN